MRAGLNKSWKQHPHETAAVQSLTSHLINSLKYWLECFFVFDYLRINYFLDWSFCLTTSKK